MTRAASRRENRGVLLSVTVALVIVAIGVGLTTAIADRLPFEERLAIGAAVGVVSVSVAALLAFLLCGMGGAALAFGLGLPGAGALAGLGRRRACLRREAAWAWRRLRLPARSAGSLRPLAAFATAGAVVSTRILALSYQRTSTGISAGSLATWSDWTAHLAYAASFAYGDNRGLDLPTAAGTPFRYHFLVDFFGSLFTVTGATLQQSMALSAWLLAITLPVLLWCAITRLVRSNAVACVAVSLFVLNGGIGLLYFLRDVRKEGWRILGSLPQTYARIPDHHLWVDNTLSASLYAQRSTLLGLTVGAAVLILVLASRPSWSRRGFLGAGLLLGVLGIGHAHTLATGVALGAVAWVADRRARWAWFVLPALVVGVPLAAAIAPETNATRLMVGWMAPAARQPWLWFWIRNVGLLLPLAGAVALLGLGPARLRRVTAPLWLWFAIPNVVAFHPAEWNNTKFFLFWQFGCCLLIAAWLVPAWRRARRSAGAVRWLVPGVAVAAVGLLISVGSLDTLRAMQRSTAIPWADHDEVAAAAWIRLNTPTDAVLVYGATNHSAMAALGGRSVVTGYTGWTWDLGLPDWAQRWSDSRAVLSGSSDAASAIARYGVDYVQIGPAERRGMAASDAYWEANGALVFRAGEYRIYVVSRP